ncbi:MAG: hypothetical protein QOD38_1564 [Acidimicrobiaceae bacterium]
MQARPAAELGAIVGASLVFAIVAPLDVAVFGLLVVGVTHVLLEVRYVIGRYPPAVSGHPAIILQAGVLMLVAVRLASAQSWGPSAEILLWTVLVVGALVHVVAPSRPVWAAGLVGVTLVVALAAWSDPVSWFVVLAHAHNVVAAAFVWDWTRTVASRRTRSHVRTAIAVWMIVVPLALLGGALDVVTGTGSRLASGVVPIKTTLATVTPPSLRSGAVPTRLLALFAFAQLVHYGVWCWWLPRHAPDVTAASSTTRAGKWLQGARLLVMATVGTAAVVGAATVGYSDGRTVYSAFAAYHAYLEFPVLVVLFATWTAGGRRAHLAP